MKYTLYVSRKDHTFHIALGAWLSSDKSIVIINHGTLSIYEYEEITRRPSVTVWFSFQNNVYGLFKRGNCRNERAGIVERENVYFVKGGNC